MKIKISKRDTLFIKELATYRGGYIPARYTESSENLQRLYNMGLVQFHDSRYFPSMVACVALGLEPPILNESGRQAEQGFREAAHSAVQGVAGLDY